MKRLGIVPQQLLILVAYSVLFIILTSFLGDGMIGPQWVMLIMHIVLLFGVSIYRFTRPESELKKTGKMYLLAALLVGIIGHGLCLFNGMLHFKLH